MSAVWTLETFHIKVPETFLVSAGGALFPDCGGDGTASVSFADRQLRPLGIPPEEGPAGVAGDSTVVTAGLSQPLVTHLTQDLCLPVRHFTRPQGLEIFEINN